MRGSVSPVAFWLMFVGNVLLIVAMCIHGAAGRKLMKATQGLIKADESLKQANEALMRANVELRDELERCRSRPR